MKRAEEGRKWKEGEKEKEKEEDNGKKEIREKIMKTNRREEK